MEDDSEVLDWGHEEEDSVAVHGSEQRTFSMDDAEDAVSLGGDEEDEFLTYQSRVPQDSQRAHSPPKSARHQQQEPINTPQSPDPFNERLAFGDQPSSLSRHSLGTLVHALPPKPVISNVSFVYPSHPSIIEATAMASRADRDRRNGSGSKATAYDHNDSLPPGWEVKYPRSGRGVYYYNIHTQESTWTRPTATSTREKRSERSDRRDDPLDKSLSTRNETITPRVGRADSGDMSYDDRHYRPGESGRREDRPPSSQLIDSYVPDSYSPNPRNIRPSPPPPRARDRDPSPPPRRPLSAAGSNGDHDGLQGSHREAPLAPLSAQDRIWVARDSASHERPRERRQRDDPLPPETDRRNLPRDTDRSSTLRPKSPASYTCGSQESANTTPRSSIKPSLPPSEALGKKSRFSQADSPVQHGNRQSDSRDAGMRRTRTDDVAPHSARYVDDVPGSRTMLDVHGDDNLSTHPVSDAQRPGSRKRTALPPQDEAFRPGARPVFQRSGGYPSGPVGATTASVPENRHSSRSNDPPRTLAQRSPSPLHPQSGPLPDERDDRGRGRPRWSKSRANGPSQMGPQTTLESSRSRAHDVAMDVDDVLLTRSLDPPQTKQIPPRRPALQDDVPRYPRAMLNSDIDGPLRNIREMRDAIDSRLRHAADDSSRFGTSRDRQGAERHFGDQTAPKEPMRGVETKSGPNVKLSGTNNIPIGARNKFTGNVPPAPVPQSTPRRAPAATSGSNGEPVGPRRDRINRDHERPPHLDIITTDKGTQLEPIKREDGLQSPLNNSRALPQIEPEEQATRPSRAALGISRFGPPIIKENTQKSVSSESLPSEQIPEGSTRATPPPPSRESSMTSFKEAPLPVRPAHLPPRPASPPRGFRNRLGDTNKPYHRSSARSPGTSDIRANEVDVEAPPLRPRPSSPPPRKRAIDAYPAPAAPRDANAYSSKHPRTNVRDSEVDHQVARPPASLAVQDEGRDHAPPPMHPERALMLQANGLPPRPPSAVGRARPGKGTRRDRRDDRDHDRAEPLRGSSMGRHRSTSPGTELRRYPEEDRSVHRSGGGGSLLDRLSLDDGRHVNSPSLRERVQLPIKRDREEMLAGNLTLDTEEDCDGTKRVRRRAGGKGRKGRP